MFKKIKNPMLIIQDILQKIDTCTVTFILCWKKNLSNNFYLVQKVDPEIVFTKQERIGKGSFGEVFKGIDNRTQQVGVLLKNIHMIIMTSNYWWLAIELSKLQHLIISITVIIITIITTLDLDIEIKHLIVIIAKNKEPTKRSINP